MCIRDSYRRVEVVNATILPKGTLKINRVWMNRNKMLELDSMNQQILQSGTRWRTAAASSSSCSNSSIATHRTVAAAAATALCAHKYMPGSCVARYIISSPRGTQLWNHTRCQTKKEAKKKVHKKKNNLWIEPSTWDAQGVKTTCRGVSEVQRIACYLVR